ncbi:LEM domain-containing protein [Ditylenchus destructor]|nr:LEM domain-containing protein [Ditylenchus destructor]
MVMKPISDLDDAELRSELASYGSKIGPIVGTTRHLYEKKLEILRNGTKSGTTKNAKVSTKRTPTKGSAPAPALVHTPISAKKKGRSISQSSQSSVNTESSDNEMDLNIADSSSPATRQGRSTGSKKTAVESHRVPMSDYSPPRGVVKRTPTPPRSSKRTPLRESGDTSLSGRGNIFMSDDRTRKFQSSFDHEEDEDDHMESSRIITPTTRFDPFRSSLGGIPSSTKQSQKYSRYSPVGKYSANKLVSTPKALLGLCDTSGWILSILGAFLAVLFATYLWTASPNTITHTFTFIKGAVGDTFNFFYRYAVLPVLALTIIVCGCFAVLQFYKRRESMKEERKQQRNELIDKITDLIRDANEEGIAEPHVRDLLMPPTKRTADDWKLWNQAAEFINNEDSRVRTEVRLINGIECNVWVWVPVGKQKWQGTAVTKDSLSNDLPKNALARCIKIRGLKFSERHSLAGPPESIVYLMLRNLDEAKRAFMAFHSHWFNGSLLTVKYVREERYLERYPVAGRG